ncbi:uncharacterized protein BO80DRAFT_443363 [Aspergillus ibericus CBS 121593]|uniref:Uncharacterized protein n=1 Tax=Aspergillus ibericus CBS 121593 TaxID=1448316 RepID=A0A395H3W4_9EURO|nr:hypothetical protein BO80DRAFT_443363 [Aspergillus ibericus CBS 121593]RAL02562.1 hypothetical protein BO80DRAFT_443363 [Aspergillus ibericus CBS 121593]
MDLIVSFFRRSAFSTRNNDTEEEAESHMMKTLTWELDMYLAGLGQIWNATKRLKGHCIDKQNLAKISIQLQELHIKTDGFCVEALYPEYVLPVSKAHIGKHPMCGVEMTTERFMWGDGVWSYCAMDSSKEISSMVRRAFEGCETNIGNGKPSLCELSGRKKR